MQTFTGMQYLQIDIANNFGLDKEDWISRLQWFTRNEANLESLIDKAEEPALYYAAVKAYRAAQRGEPSGYPISLDATSSGLQIMACLTGDRKAAELCNVVNVGKRMDAYKEIYDVMLGSLGEKGQINRKDTKRAIMTWLYSSVAVPKEVFGEGALLALFYETMFKLAPGPAELNTVMLDLWQPDVLSHDWVLPDNFHVKVKVMSQVKETVHFLNAPYETFRNVNAATETGRSLGANTIHSIDGMIVREMIRRCNYNAEKVAQIRNWLGTSPVFPAVGSTEDFDMCQELWGHYMKTGYLSARILDHLDQWNIVYYDNDVIKELINSLPAKPFEVISIHDCFRCLPNYGNDLRQQYNLQLHLIAKSELLSNLISQIVGRDVNVGKLDSTLADDILGTEYALS